MGHFAAVWWLAAASLTWASATALWLFACNIYTIFLLRRSRRMAAAVAASDNDIAMRNV
jgi:hypothetical protein